MQPGVQQCAVRMVWRSACERPVEITSIAITVNLFISVFLL
jgi:hypothetical protein